MCFDFRLSSPEIHEIVGIIIASTKVPKIQKFNQTAYKRSPDVYRVALPLSEISHFLKMNPY